MMRRCHRKLVQQTATAVAKRTPTHTESRSLCRLRTDQVASLTKSTALVSNQTRHHHHHRYNHGDRPWEQERFGPQASTNMRTIKKEGGMKFRGILNFKQLGFPVEIPGPEAETQDIALELLKAMCQTIDVHFLNPKDPNMSRENPDLKQLRMKINSLKQMCMLTSRSLKFAVNRDEQTGLYTCRTMLRDEWDTVPRLQGYTTSEPMRSANASLISEFEKIHLQYQSELSSDAKVLEDFNELKAYLKANHEVEDAVLNKVTDEAKKTQVTVQLTDIYGNVKMFQSNRRTEVSEAIREVVTFIYRDVGGLAFSHHRMRGTSLLAKMRWQLEGMSQQLYDEQTSYTDAIVGAWGADRYAEQPSFDGFVLRSAESDGSVRMGKAGHLPVYHGTYSMFGEEYEEAGAGALRIEIECYAKALTKLISDHPQMAAQYPFPTVRNLDGALTKMKKGCNVMALCRGAPTPYASLGATVKHHVGSVYQVLYDEERSQDAHGTSISATIVVDDKFSNSQRFLGKATTMNRSEAHLQMARGDAWKNCCRQVLEANFPAEFEDVKSHPTFGDVSKSTVQTLTNASAPKEKIVTTFSSLLDWLNYLGIKHLGWKSIEVTTVPMQPGGPFVGQLKVVDGNNPKPKVLVTAPPMNQTKVAKRCIVRFAMKKLFPEDLEIYLDLDRGDHNRKDQFKDLVVGEDVYDVTRPLVAQIVELIEKQDPALAPVKYNVTRFYGSGNLDCDNDGSMEDLMKPFTPRFKATIMGGTESSVLTEQIGSEDDGPLQVLRSALAAAMTSSGVPKQKSDAIFKEFAKKQMSVTNTSTSRSFATSILDSFIGGGTDTEKATDFEYEAASIPTLPQVTWAVTVTVPSLGGLATARVFGPVKKEVLKNAAALAIRLNFRSYLKQHRQHNPDAEEVVTSILTEEINTKPPARTQIEEKKEKEQKLPPPPAPNALLKKLVEVDDPKFTTRHEQIPVEDGYICRMFRQRVNAGRVANKGKDLQEIGIGKAATKPQSLHLAAIHALDNLFEEELAEVVKLHPTYVQLPQSTTVKL